MLESWLARSLPVGRVCRGLTVGPATIDVVFARPAAGSECRSGATMRLAEELGATAVHRPRGLVRVAALPPSGRPVATIAGTHAGPRVSVSHVAGLLGAAVSLDGSPGLDIVDPATAGRGLDAFLTPDELALLPDDTGLVRGLLWAAKEAAFKAAALDVEFRPLSVAIESLTPGGFAWTLAGPFGHVAGVGRFAAVAGHVVALAATGPGAAIGRGANPWKACEEQVACS
ncbi:MAG: 4'-phosphopantetheinyl transferase superfamily protein [Planctomycetia bacterium]|jgi:hypothetical protein